MTQDSRLERSIFEADDRPIRRRDRHRVKPRGGRRVAVLIAAVMVVVAGGYAAYSYLGPQVASLMGGSAEETDFDGSGSGTVSITVPDGATGEDIATLLRDQGVVKTRAAYLASSSADPQRSAAIQPGTYPMREKMSAAAAFAVLTDSTNRIVAGVTIREGLWASEIVAELADKTDVPVADYEAALANPTALGLPEGAGGNAEGYLFPSTYDFAQGMPAAEQLSQMIAKTVHELEAAGVEPTDFQRVLTMASIVEGEVSSDADRPKVARVIYNRLKAPEAGTVGRLQMDSTVHYLSRERGQAGTSDTARASNSPYNTYLRAGLPPGPINSPGLASIKAVLKPADGNWFFFVTVNPDTGETRFAATQAEHDANVAQFNQWCKANADRC